MRRDERIAIAVDRHLHQVLHLLPCLIDAHFKTSPNGTLDPDALVQVASAFAMAIARNAYAIQQKLEVHLDAA